MKDTFLIVDDESLLWGGIHYGRMLAQLKSRKADPMNKTEIPTPQDQAAILPMTLPFSKTPEVENQLYERMLPKNRRMRRRNRAFGPGTISPVENNNRQANLKAAEASAKAKRKATHKMKKAARRRARA